jgi:hypothetical protein
MNYYNEWEPFAGEWLKELIKDGLIPDGTVDNRSIADVEPSDLKGFTQCHFFAGIGGWSRALELARWSPERPVWTGAHRANLFQQRGTTLAKTMNDISGLSSSISSASAALQQSLESRLRQQLDLDGLTIYKLTWRHKVTPQRRSYCHLAASALRTKEKDSSSWPTPSVRDYKDTGNLDKSRFRKSGKERNDTVPRVAYGIAPWATPNVSMTFPVNMGQQVAFGTTPQSSTAETENTVPSQLNPRFSLWLMGYPIEWAYCAERVTPLSRKRQPKL